MGGPQMLWKTLGLGSPIQAMRHQIRVSGWGTAPRQRETSLGHKRFAGISTGLPCPQHNHDDSCILKYIPY
jgi:hypothetical protein